MTTNAQSLRPVIIWLFLVCAFIFAMVLVGGVTRLTHSGLSIVEWQPLIGAIPPLNEAQWMATFEAYKQYPEYLKMNQGMSLDEFKGIFYWEYGHRLLGRTIGLVFFIPFVVFWLQKRFDKPLLTKLGVAFIIGGLQGLMGWYMVMSGLVDIPRVSHYRLAAHLSLALFLMCYLFWVALDLIHRQSGSTTAGGWVRPAAWAMTVLVSVQIVYGAFTAGLRAGWGYNTFPTMNGEWFPEALSAMSPIWLNLLENNAGVQFMHRLLGTLLLLAIAWFWWAARQASLNPLQRNCVTLLLVSVLLQYGIGVYVLLKIVPIAAAAAHQAVGCLVLLAAVRLNFHLRQNAR